MPRDPERAPGERATDEERTRSREEAPPAKPGRRPLDPEPGVEWHAGEDAGEVPGDDADVTRPEEDERDAGEAGVTPA
jgi:hypothetical protein